MNKLASVSRFQQSVRSASVVGEAIRLQHISKEYMLDSVTIRALCDISCSIMTGQTTFVVGPSGSGKSTLLNILGLLDRPTSGQISLLGTNVTDLSDAEAADFRSKHIGFVFQSFNLIPVLTLRENVEFPLHRRNMSPSKRRAQASDYLAAVGLNNLMNRRPGEVSGGQRQRAAVARALVTEPDFVIADEPTANLDSKTSRDVVSLLDKMRREFNTSIVICTHQLDLITSGSEKIEIIDGRLA